MKKTIYILGAISIAAVTCLLLSFKQKPDKISYQYITIIARNWDLDEVAISIDGKEFIQKKLTSESKGKYDMNPILNIVHQYESEGYELQNFTGSGMLFHYFWLRKEKN